LRHRARNQTLLLDFPARGSPPSGNGAGPEDSILNCVSLAAGTCGLSPKRSAISSSKR